jgi:hypothetical protein
VRAIEQLIEYEAMLHESVHRVGRAVRNMRQEMGGFSSCTPGNGSPGGGKGGRPTVSIDDPSDPSDPDGVDVPVTSVESQALFGRDDAAADLVRLHRRAGEVADGAAALLVVDLGLDAGPDWPDRSTVGADRMVVLGYARVLRLREHTHGGASSRRPRDHLERPVADVFHLGQAWGYDTREPTVTKDRADLLAVDLTEMWCTSHLRVGVRRDRSRGELCDWCYRHGPLLVASWDAPPRDLVRLHVDNGKVYAHQFEPYIKAERDRQKRLTKAGRR